MRKYNLTFKNSLILIIVFLGLLSTEFSFAANWHVRPNGGSYGLENGSDWNNAFDGMPTTWTSIVAGDTIYVAGGTYTTAWVVGSNGSSGLPITIKKATVSEHGTNTGWQASFDGQVILSGNISNNCINLSIRSYINIDGVTEYGFHITCNPTIGIVAGIRVENANNLTFKYMKLDGTANGDNYQAFFLRNASNITIGNSWFFNVPNDPFYIGDSNNIVMERNLIGPRGDSISGIHADVIDFDPVTTNVTFRYNVVDWDHQILWDDVVNLYVYGNVFYDTRKVGLSQAVKIQTGPVYVYNNVFYDIFRAFILSGVGGEIKNNIVYSVESNHDFGNTVHDYNFYSGSNIFGETNGVAGGTVDPFVNGGSFDFHLKSTALARNKGVSLGSSYNQDRDGNRRGLDGFWDIGAYEFVSSSSDFTPPNPPTGLVVN